MTKNYELMESIYNEIPTFSNGNWTTTIFKSREEFRDFLIPLFKQPGEYEFDESSYIFNEQGNLFKKNKQYCSFPIKTKDYIKYWEFEKEKCRKGIIVKNKGKTWWISRDYYMWLNFLPIYDKEEKVYDFPKIRDAQYHMSLYEHLAELHNKHAAIFKKRQIASSYFHSAKIINQYWFESGAVLKIGASLKDYISENGTWRMLSEYRSFLNEHTAWYRPSDPDKVFSWQQRIKVRTNGRDTYKGNKSLIVGVSFEKDPTSGVGGPCRYFFHEEAGIAPKLDKTYEYILPSLQSGSITTGMFIAAGSVGDLDQCEPLKQMILRPDAYDIYPVYTNLLDKEGTYGKSGLFIPEQWSMPPFIDEYGNSKVEEALEEINKKRIEWKENLNIEQYQLRISQKPTNIEEGFAVRKESKFPLNLVLKQMQRINDKEYPVEYVDLYRDEETGKVKDRPSRKIPIMEFPVSKKLENKEGVICVYERPIKDAKFGIYYGSVDPVGEGKAEWVENLVYTPDGRKKIGDLKVGDYVIGSNGKPIRVTGVFPQGKKSLYRVGFNDGFGVLVCEDHLWAVRKGDLDKSEYHVLSVKQLLEKDGYIEFKGIGRNKDKLYKCKTWYKNPNGSSRWMIPMVKPIQFSKKNLPADPYLLGLLLGDGGLTTRSIRYASADQELLDYISSLLPEDITIKKVSKYDHRISTYKNRNSLTAALRKIGVMGKGAATKFIPDDYLYSSIEDRLSLLRGLMDTDGYCGNHGAEFYSISKMLATQVVQIVQSLGGVARIRKKIINPKNRPDGRFGVGYCYVVRVALPDGVNPFKLSRKADKYYTPKYVSRYIENIELVTEGDAVCISVDAPDKLYVTEYAIVTHNTTTSESLCSIYIYKNPIDIIKDEGNGKVSNIIEGDKIVASWCGRFDDLNKTHERLELLIEWYNAWTIVENNVALFIQYMISKKKQKYLVPKDMILFLKDIGANRNVFQEYGWKNVGSLFKGNLLSYGIEFLKEEIDHETNPNGEIVKVIYGVERIPDIMLLKEMHAYREGLNVDRLVSFCALVAFAKVQQSNRGIPKLLEVSKENFDKSKKSSKLNYSMFRHLGKNGDRNSFKNSFRNPFKNLR